MGSWEIIYSQMMKLFNLENSEQFFDLTLRPTKVPLFAKSMVVIEPQIVFRNLSVPVLILDPISENDPMPFGKENQALKKNTLRRSTTLFTQIPNTISIMHIRRSSRKI